MNCLQYSYFDKHKYLLNINRITKPIDIVEAGVKKDKSNTLDLQF